MKTPKSKILTAAVILIGIIGLIFFATTQNNEGERNRAAHPTPALISYRPMIYVMDHVYIDPSHYETSLPEGYALLGMITKKVSQTEPMVTENFASNSLPVDSEIYYNEAFPDVVYIKSMLDSQEIYITYGTLAYYDLQ
jgi:hypothetical protein